MSSTKLEEKIDAAVKRWQNVEKKKMFGGIGYLLKGNMCFGIFNNSLIVRIDKGTWRAKPQGPGGDTFRHQQ